MNLRLLILFILGLSKPVSSQNLVPNPSFESYINCSFSQGDADHASGWFKSSVFNQPPSHADYCNSCSNFYGVPNNPWGTENAATGNGYIAMTTKVPAWGQYRENIYAQLISPLSIGTTYSLSFKISLCDNFRLASDKMGLKFSMFPNISISNSAHLFASTPVSQQNGWTVITGTFTADSAYTYIGVGNFFDDANTNEVLVCPSCTQNYNIYYLDDISVSPIAALPPVSLFYHSGNSCMGSTVQLTDSSSNNPNSWLWTVNPQNGSAISNPAAQHPNIVFSQSGTYTVSLQASNSSGAGNTYTSTVQIYPPPSLTLSSNQASVCAGGSVQLTATGANAYNWINPSQQGSSIFVYPQQSRFYSVMATDSNGCSAKDSIFVIVRPLPSLSITATGLVLCYGTSTQLLAFGAQTYTWLPGNSNNNPFLTSPASTTIYTVTGSDAFGCKAKQQLTITVSECIGIESQSGSTDLFYYPNPSNGQITFSTGLPEDAELSIINSLGQLIKTFSAREVNENERRLDLSVLGKGIYLVQIRSGSGIAVSPLIIQ